MSKKFQLQVSQPCHENWDKMTPVDKGRFCDSCQKAVHDFTGMSDAQLIAFFKKPSNGSVCGRFYNDQLERDFEIPGKRLPWLRYFFQFTIPVFLTTLKIQAQENKLVKERITPDMSTTCARELSQVMGKFSYPQSSKKIIGMVTDEKGRAISFATIYLKDSKKGTICDSTGFFQMEIPADEKKITLIASSVGYLSKEKGLNTRKDNFTQITLTPNIVSNSEVVITSGRIMRLGGAQIVSAKISFLKRVKDYFLVDSITIFPNPAKAGNDIKIEWKRAIAGEYNIELFNLQGQLIQSTPSKIQSGATVFTIYLPVVTPGTYVIQLTNKKTGKKHAERIIIQ